jgi:CheY-like chemotaxis protein
VLCADDEPAIMELVKFSLEVAGYAVIGCSNGAEALAQARLRAPFMAILDIDMPEMNGLQVCRALRAMPQLRDLPIVFLTGHAEQDSIRQALQEGATDYLIKPFERDDLLDRVHCLSRLSLVKEEMAKLNTRYEVFQRRLKDLLGK